MEQKQLKNIQKVVETRQQKLERLKNVEKSLKKEVIQKENIDNQ